MVRVWFVYMPHSHAKWPRPILTHVEVGHAAVSQQHDEFGLIRPPLLLPSSKQVLDRGGRGDVSS